MAPGQRFDSWLDDDTDDGALADLAARFEESDGDDLFDAAPARPARRTGRPAKPGKASKPARHGKARRGTDPFDAALDDELDGLDADDELTEAVARKAREKRRAEISEPFKCRNCKAFIGTPPTGGQQRNHCPMCLYSLHVDDKTPGDRASDCRSLMEAVGVFYRRNLEQVLVHRCLGCGFTRYNRIAADDNPLLLAELPIVDLPTLGDDGERDERNF